jgi:hypothetical protein
VLQDHRCGQLLFWMQHIAGPRCCIGAGRTNWPLVVQYFTGPNNVTSRSTSSRPNSSAKSLPRRFRRKPGDAVMAPANVVVVETEEVPTELAGAGRRA